MPQLRVFLLGAPRIACEGEEVKLPHHKALALLAYGALFALMGVLLRRPLIPGLLFLFLCSVALVARAVNLQVIDSGYLQDEGNDRMKMIGSWIAAGAMAFLAREYKVSIDTPWKKLPKKYWMKINYLLVTFGQNHCAPLSPKCSTCPIRLYCNRVGVKISR